MKDEISYRILKDSLFKWVVIVISLLATVPLILIFFYITKNGIAVINWEFLTHLPRPVGEIGGGISNAIIGTGILILLASFFSVPIGVCTGIYLSEYRSSKFSYWVGVCAEILQGVPSIVIGIAVYVWVVMTFGTFSALSGGIALGVMMLPIIVKSTEETLNLIPHSLKETSLALGVPYYRTMIKVLVPAGMSGIVTGILIGIARIAGETAPLLFTAFGNPNINYNIFKPINSLPLLIFNYAMSPYSDWHTIAWGASFILIVFVLVLNISARLITRRWKIQF